MANNEDTSHHSTSSISIDADALSKIFKLEVNEIRVEFKGKQNSMTQGDGVITLLRITPKKVDGDAISWIKSDAPTEDDGVEKI